MQLVLPGLEPDLVTASLLRASALGTDHASGRPRSNARVDGGRGQSVRCQDEAWWVKPTGGVPRPT
jgi:hypothetical protein